MEIWFYHLMSQPLERALPALIEKAVGRGWRVIVETVDDLRSRALDDLLWTFSAESFLPHASAKDKGAERQPILVTNGQENLNAAALRMYVEGAEIGLDPTTASYERVMLLFDGRDDIELAAARRQWSRLKNEGFTLTYWKQNEAGAWKREM